MRMRLLAAVGMVMVAGQASADSGERWARASAPVAGPPQVLGSAAAGCISGAVPLPADGDGWQVLRLQRNRFYSHPNTIAFLRRLAGRAKAESLGTLLVADMSQPRGGPMPSGHASHQNGLDVDIWYRLPDHPLSDDERADPQGISMVKGAAIDRRHWTPAQARLVELAARSPEVDRIFVNPPIKVELCHRAGADRAWLSKIRPWFGHDEHFHVRLSCPAGSIGCVPQAPVPDGDGCGAEVASWLAKGTIQIPSDKPNHRNPTLPAACQAVLGQPGTATVGRR